MAIVFALLAILLATLMGVGLVPTPFHLVGRAIGAQTRSKTQRRRELFFARAAEEEARQTSSQDPLANKSASSTSLDEEWEKVDDGADTPTATTTSTAKDQQGQSYDGVIGFFHPFCNAGGGGERVLFAAILATQQRYPRALCVVYTGDHDASKEKIISNVRNRFNIELNPARVCFIYLSTREWVLASKWPHFTLLGQSLGSLILAWDAFNLLVPDIFIDTMGYAFTLALCKWLFPKTPTGAYVHYPTISTDMLSSLHDASGNQGVNSGLGKGSLGKAKQIYWELFAKLYSWVGGSIDIVMTNSSWTQNHITQLWASQRQRRRKKQPITVVYPPCAVEELASKILVDEASEKTRTRDLLYIAQFRQEKMHHIIIDAFINLIKHNRDVDEPKPNLILVGSVRDDTDEKRVYKLRLQAQEVKNHVQFVVNAKWPQILDFLKSSSVGVNGMWNEHFGIGVVEYQAAGLISVVNDSGGPKEDIVIDIDGKPTGFHASTTEQFTEGFSKALSLSREDTFAMRLRARKSARRFSEVVFSRAWTDHLERLVEISSQSSAARKSQA